MQTIDVQSVPRLCRPATAKALCRRDRRDTPASWPPGLGRARAGSPNCRSRSNACRRKPAAPRNCRSDALREWRRPFLPATVLRSSGEWPWTSALGLWTRRYSASSSKLSPLSKTTLSALRSLRRRNSVGQGGAASFMSGSLARPHSPASFPAPAALLRRQAMIPSRTRPNIALMKSVVAFVLAAAAAMAASAEQRHGDRKPRPCPTHGLQRRRDHRRLFQDCFGRRARSRRFGRTHPQVRRPGACRRRDPRQARPPLSGRRASCATSGSSFGTSTSPWRTVPPRPM